MYTLHLMILILRDGTRFAGASHDVGNVPFFPLTLFLRIFAIRDGRVERDARKSGFRFVVVLLYIIYSSGYRAMIYT